ncbi:MAG: RNA-binding S4 domain-containing protein [Burkholderiales bacterium]
MVTDNASRVRIDKWLWAARFYKTRSLAAQAVEGGKAQLNGERVKPAKVVKVGDHLDIRNGPFTWTITVQALSERRGSASVAALLYSESEQSKKEREEKAALLKAERQSSPVYGQGRPTKKARRQMIRFLNDES